MLGVASADAQIKMIVKSANLRIKHDTGTLDVASAGILFPIFKKIQQTVTITNDNNLTD